MAGKESAQSAEPQINQIDYFANARLGTKSPEMPRTPIRPLGEFSDYVVQVLPQSLEAVATQAVPDASRLVQETEEVAKRGLEINLLQLDDEGVKIARLDAQMAYNAVVHANEHTERAGDFVTPGPKLARLAHTMALATARPRAITYEDVVYDNPTTDMRLFTSGGTGWSEAGFYAAHQIIEYHLSQMIPHMYSAIMMLDEGDTASEELYLELYNALIQWCVNLDLTISLKDDMPNDDFRWFREYLGGFTDPLTGNLLKGASGQQSSRVRETDFLLRGHGLVHDTNSSYMQDIARTWDYFPRAGIGQLSDAMRFARAGKTISTYMDRGGMSTRITDVVGHLHRAKDLWRSLHMRAVKGQMPDIMKGTGGEDVKKYLASIMKETRSSHNARNI